MISEQVLIKEIYSLPENLKEEVLHYVQFLKEKHQSQSEPKPPRKKRKAGSAKGMFVMTEAFDEPLEDFAEYM